MTHPTDLFADYVDETLPEHDRAAIEAHLATCEACRDEVRLSRAGHAALGRLPDVAAPVGVASKALREATGAAAPNLSPRWPRWIPAVAAALLLLVVAIGLPHLLDHGIGAGTSREAAAGAPPGTASAPTTSRSIQRLLRSGVQVSRQVKDYTVDDVRRLIDSNAQGWSGAIVPVPAAAPTPGRSEAFAATKDAEASTAVACLARQVESAPNEVLVQLIDARFEGAPAYLAVILESPRPGTQVDKVLVWVVHKNDCTIANFAQGNL